MKKEELAKDLIHFINRSPDPFHAVKNIKSELVESGYVPLSEGDKWDVTPGGKYLIERNGSSLIAVNLGKSLPWDRGFKIVGAHTDSPLFKVKNESLKRKNGLLQLNIETYGGGINSSWLDRDLSLSGRVTLEVDGVIKNELVDFNRSLGTIPNLAIHLNREVNKGFEYNKQNHLALILGQDVDVEEKDLHLRHIIAKEFGFKENTILEMDLYLYDNTPGVISGLNRDLISVGRLDNLAMCHSIYRALIDGDNRDSSSIGVFYDNEEVGSKTMQGADSNFLNSIIDRLIISLGGSAEDSYRARYKSFMISADGAHAIHPNFPDKHDPSYSPVIGGGPVIKLSANYRYATTSTSAASFIQLCKKLDIPFQKMANRSDVPSGSTIGPMSSATLGIETIDVGNPMFAMHSIRETQGVLDHYYMTRILQYFYS